jgi:elongation factor Ts
VTGVALGTGVTDVDSLKACRWLSRWRHRSEKLTNNIATIGENQTLRRREDRVGQQWRVVSLCPQCRRAGMGKIGVLVALESMPVPMCLNRWASRSRCTSPLPSRWR